MLPVHSMENAWFRTALEHYVAGADSERARPSRWSDGASAQDTSIPAERAAPREEPPHLLRCEQADILRA